MPYAVNPEWDEAKLRWQLKMIHEDEHLADGKLKRRLEEAGSQERRDDWVIARSMTSTENAEKREAIYARLKELGAQSEG